MLTELDIKRALNRCASVYPPPKDPAGTMTAWRDVLISRAKDMDITPDELDAALADYMASPERWGPTPGQLVELVRVRRGSPTWQEREPEAPAVKLTSEELRATWARHGVDLAELEARNKARRARAITNGGAA